MHRTLWSIYAVSVLQYISLCAMGDVEQPVSYSIEKRSEELMDQKMAICDALLSRLSKYTKIAPLADMADDFFASNSAIYIGEIKSKTQRLFAGISRARLSKKGMISAVHTALELPQALSTIDSQIVENVSKYGSWGQKLDLYSTHLHAMGVTCSHLYANIHPSWKSFNGIPCMPCDPKTLIAACMFSLIRKMLPGKGLAGFFIKAHGTETSFGIENIISAHALYDNGAYEDLSMQPAVSKGTAHFFTLLFMK